MGFISGLTVRKECLASITRAFFMVIFGYVRPGEPCQTIFPTVMWLKNSHKATVTVREEEERKAWSEAPLYLVFCNGTPCPFEKCHSFLAGAPPYLTQQFPGNQYCGLSYRKVISAWMGRYHLYNVRQWQLWSFLGSHKRAIGPNLTSWWDVPFSMCKAHPRKMLGALWRTGV